jgi:WD40 repeat protein/class 3 adenylate cyclase
MVDGVGQRGTSVKTFLIADVRGYTTFTQARGDEAAARLATRFAQLARARIEAGGGSLLELRGDEALAVFDSTRQAIRAALELQSQFVEETIADPSLPLAVGIGLDVGEAVPVDGGYRGGALNLAARLCSIADAGEILASRELAHLARKVDGVKYVERGAIRLKGLDEPVIVIAVRPEVEDLTQNVGFRRALGPVSARVGHRLETRNPYKGLRAFEEADAADFFGREALTKHLVERLASTRFLAVVGPSGSGKSSVVRAGLVPELRRGALPESERWQVAQMFPGAYPLEELEAALLRVAVAGPDRLMELLEDGERGLLRAVKQILPDDGSELVLVVDQLEEVFTLVDDERQRVHFLALLERAVLDPHSRLRVVTTLRADFYDRPLLYSGFAELLRDYVEAVVPLTADQFERAIVGPADAVGVGLEAGLLAEMVADVAHEPGALPLLQYALTELYERREAEVLTREAYVEIGGVSGALAGRAEEVYLGLEPTAQEASRQLFLRLVTLGEGTEDTRRRVERGELDAIEVDQDSMTEAIGAFGGSRLLSFDRDPRSGAATVEVAHEALLREWGRLRRWIDSAREVVRLHRRLVIAAREWEGSSRDQSFLLRGGHLAQFDSLTDSSGVALTGLEREFVDASRDEDERELLRQQRENRRLKALLAGAGVLLLLALAAGVVALLQRQSAKHQATVALARQLGTEAVSEPRVDRAMLLAREAVKLDASRQTAGTLLATLLRSPAALGTFSSPITDRPQAITLSPDGRTLAVVENTDSVRFYDTRTRTERRRALPHAVHIPAAYSSDGTRIVLMRTPSETAPPALDVRDGRTLQHLQFLRLDRRWLTTPTSFANPLLLSRDGRTAYMAYSAVNQDTQRDGPAYIDRWDTRSGKLLRTSALGSNGMFDALLTRSGRLLVLTDTQIVTLDGKTLRRLRSVPVHLPESSFNALAALEPNGETIAIGSLTGSVQFVDTKTGRTTVGAGKSGNAVQRVAFSPTGDVAVTTNESGQVLIWDPKTADVVETFTGHEDRTLGLTFSADGETLYTCSLDGAIFEWDLAGSRRFGRPFRTTSAAPLISDPSIPALPPLAVSPDGKRFATRTGPDEVGIFSVATARRIRVLRVQPAALITAVAWSPTADELAIAGMHGRVELWGVGARPRAVRSLQRLSPVTKRPESINAVGFSPDGSLVAAAAVNQTAGNASPIGLAGVWRAGDGELIWRRVHRAGQADALAFAGDGKSLAVSFEVGRQGGQVKILDPLRERTVRTLGTIDGVPSLAFAPDGTLVTGSWSGIVQRWKVSTGKQLGRPVLAMPAPVASISFDPSGRTFATGGGSGGFVKLWDTKTLQQIGTAFPGEPGKWANAAFTPDGSSLITLYEDGHGSVWPGSIQAWEAHACRVAGRNLTHEEWSRYITGRSYALVCADQP